MAELYLQSWSQTAIAEQVGVSQVTIHNDLQAIRKRWLQSQVRDFHEAVVVQLAKIDRLERESWAGWERSKAPREKTVMTQGKTGDKRGSKTVQQRDGNARYLAQVERCITARANLLGLNAPTKIAPTDPSGCLAYGAGVMQQLINMDLSNDELDALRKLRARIEQADQPCAIEVTGAVVDHVDDVDPAVHAPMASASSNAS